ncbi:MAG TPA: enolase C-terminal domain-like protein [Hyphomicrobiales bacterium]|nr:enolase C-terminal domain-like protein [Hyphomicrobiales bacterium]
MPEAAITKVSASAFKIPTDGPEADGTFSWSSTTMVLAEVTAGDRTGIGYSYTDASAAQVIVSVLGGEIEGMDAFDIPAIHETMLRRIRNIGRDGLVATAISAIDAAVWDLKGKLLAQPAVSLLGAARDAVPLYGSGGFTSYSIARLREQLGGWAREGMRWVKMKVGSEPAADPKRVEAAKDAIGDAELFVDANGAYSRKQALSMAQVFAANGVTYFEEPVSSDDLAGLRLIRDRAPAGMQIAAGEYGYNLFYFRQMLAAGATDIQQADATRCLGLTGFMQVDALCSAFSRPLSAHCAPALHLHAALAARSFWKQEWFHDHVRIERMLFDGAPLLKEGVIRADLSRPGLGLEFRRQDANKYQI